MPGPFERSYIEAQLAGIESLLVETSDEDVLGRMGLESRRDELRQRLAGLDPARGRTAQVALAFTGDPVLGSLGIDARFGAEAVASFQDLVAKLSAHRERSAEGATLRSAGPVPNQRASRLFVTDVVHGSFGFVLSEVPQTVPLLGETPLAAAVNEAASLVASAVRADEDFLESLAAVGPRVSEALKAFLGMIRKNGATVRLRTDSANVALSPKDLETAVAHAESMTVEEAPDALPGTFCGAFLGSRMFEHKLSSGALIRGRLDPPLDPRELDQQWLGKVCVANVWVVRVAHGTGRERRSFTLKSIDPLPEGRQRVD